jgi:hypothetical protein
LARQIETRRPGGDARTGKAVAVEATTAAAAAAAALTSRDDPARAGKLQAAAASSTQPEEGGDKPSPEPVPNAGPCAGKGNDATTSGGETSVDAATQTTAASAQPGEAGDVAGARPAEAPVDDGDDDASQGARDARLVAAAAEEIACAQAALLAAQVRRSLSRRTAAVTEIPLRFDSLHRWFLS